jgi:oxygen-dependent protoporphyrinogen oxidase
MLRETCLHTLKYRHDQLYDCAKLATYDDESVATYIHRRCGQEVYDYFIRPGIEPFWYFSCEDVSKALLLALHAKAANAEFFTFKEGMDTFCRQITKNLTVHTMSPVENIECRANTFEISTPKQSLSFEHVVVATTASTAKRLSQNIKPELVNTMQRQFLTQQQYAANIHASYLVPKRLCPKEISTLCACGPGEHPIAAIGFGSLKNQNDAGALKDQELVAVFLSDKKSKELLNYSGGSLYEKIWHEARKFYPSLARKAEPYKIIQRAEAIPVHSVGRYKAAAQFWQEQKAPFVFAGDYLSTATVDGAIWSGKMAAQKITGGL